MGLLIGKPGDHTTGLSDHTPFQLRASYNCRRSRSLLLIVKMEMQLQRIEYDQLSARQKENYNFQKLSAVLADFGYVAMRLSDDWNGADFIAQHIHHEAFLKVQLKSRLTFDKKYRCKGLYIAFRDGESWYMYDHDELWRQVCEIRPQIEQTASWKEQGLYCFPQVPNDLLATLENWRIPTIKQGENAQLDH